MQYRRWCTNLEIKCAKLEAHRVVSHGALRMSSVTHRDACMSVGACVLSLASSLFSLHAERTVVTQMCCTVVDVFLGILHIYRRREPNCLHSLVTTCMWFPFKEPSVGYKALLISHKIQCSELLVSY